MSREQIKVELIDAMGDDLSTVNSARVSFDKESDWEIPEDCHDSSFAQLQERDVKLINYLAKHNHSTPFRHNQIQLRCHAPIFLARQLGKHQVGLSWNEVSRRYVDDGFEFYMPDKWRGKPEGSIKQGSTEDCDLNRELIDTWYNSGIVKNSLRIYNDMLAQGVAPEMARMVLPQSMMTSWWWSGNLLAFAHVYKERISPNAQLEAQWFAEQLDDIIRPLFPVSWSALVGGANG